MDSMKVEREGGLDELYGIFGKDMSVTKAIYTYLVFEVVSKNRLYNYSL